VYVREAPGPRSIEGVPTSTTIFIGETERGPLEATAITGRREFATLFGGYRRRLTGVTDPGSERLMMPYAMDGYFANGGTRAYVLRLCDGFDVVNANTTVTAFRSEPGGGPSEFLEASSPGAWANNVAVAAALSTDSTANTDRARVRLAVFYTHPGTTTRVLVEEFDRLSPDPADDNYIVDALRRSAYIRWRANVVPFIPAALEDVQIGPFPTAASLAGVAVSLATGAGGDGTFAAASLPVFLNDRLQEIGDASLMVTASSRLGPEISTTEADFVAWENAFVTYVDSNRPHRDIFFVGELPRLVSATNPVARAANWALGTGGLSPQSQATEYNALYWPHIRVPDPIGVGRNPSIVVPPGGYIAGLYGKTDGLRGVWKAPAGFDVQLGGVTDLDFEVLDIHQDTLNPIGVNALRQIPRAGAVVWGARTRRPDTAYRYVPVRRTAIFLRTSIYANIQWAVFEPNDERLWQSLRNTISAFMEIQFRNGAFFGKTSREAYFVKVDAETTPEADRLAGIVNILVGFAPLRPSEFVVVTLHQITQPA
jgi:phage tail sheath protein FI